MDFNSLSACLDGVTRLFEDELKRLNPRVQKLTYDATDLFSFIDLMGDLSCLILTPAGLYTPHPRSFIKEQIYAMLKKQAGR